MEHFRVHANKFLTEGEILAFGGIELTVLETKGHTLGSISLFTKNIKKYRKEKYEGVILVGDVLFRRSIGATLSELDETLLFRSIRNKIIYNTELSERFLILPGHGDPTTIGAEKSHNPFGYYFLNEEDWKKNIYYGRDLSEILQIPIEKRI